MKPAAFVYHQPKTLDAALQILSEVAPQEGRILAGGQSLLPIMAFRMAKPAHLVDINAVAGLERLAVDDATLSIGARVRHAAFRAGAVPGPLGALLAQVMRNIAHHPIRTRGTFCGSLAHADPASEWCAVAATLDATLVARSATGAREIAAADFFAGIMTTVLEPDELLAEVRLPVLAADTRFGFREFNRRAGDFAMAMVLITLRIEDGRIVAPHFGVGGAEATPRRIAEVEAFLTGAALDAVTISEAARMAAAALDPLEDVATSARYRRDLVDALTRSAFQQVIAS